MRIGRMISTACLAAVLLGGRLRAEDVAPGVTFNYYQAPGPNNVYVVAIDRLRSEYKLKIGWPNMQRNFAARQTVSTIASLYDAPPAHDVLAAVNASFFGTAPAITGCTASDGELLEQPNGANETFLFGPTRLPLIREDIVHVNGKLTFADASTTTLHSYNKARAADTVVAYSPQWGPTTATATEGVEVVLTGVSYPMRGDKAVSGIVTAVQTGPASLSNAIPAGGMVISAVGTPVSTLAAKAHVGDRLTMFFDTGDNALNNADMAITGIGWLLKAGAANTANWSQYGYATQQHPRTVLAWNNSNLFMVACDGRCNGITGMTFQELADFLLYTVGATDAVNLDGGGSTTMWVDGQIRNLPADSCGTQRAVANAVLLVRQDTSTAFPVTDAFSSLGRLAGWEDKFGYNPVLAFSPASPAGDGYALRIMNASGGPETVRRGDFGDKDYAVEADVYCEYRPGLGSGQLERYCVFARDSGTGALGITNAYGPGNCYVLTYDSDSGRVRAARYTNGVITDFRETSQVFLASTAWRRLRIECLGSRIRYLVDGTAVADVIDTTHASGYFGLGYQEFFTTNSNMHGTRADNFSAVGLTPGKATSPTPALIAKSVPLNATLSWSPGAGAWSHNVYFGTNSPGEFRGNIGSTGFNPGPLQLGATYYWRVDEVGSAGTTTGDVWSFRARRYKGDFDDDGDVDQEDFGRFQGCLSGPNVVQGDPACNRARLDPPAAADSDVDAADFETFLGCAEGQGGVPPAGCLE
jgi:hypothetical protein